MKKFQILLGLPLLVFFASCDRNPQYNIGERDAYIPIYGDETALKSVSYLSPQPIVNAGKIVLYNQLLFQVEDGEGIHVFNVSNPASPVRLGFIKSPLCKELAIKNNYIITNNVDDMVVLDMSNITAVKEVKRMPGEFPEMKQAHPSQTGVYFDCPDPTKGVVVGWKLGKVTNPKCSQ